MKTIKLLFTAVAMVILASCQQQEDMFRRDLPAGIAGKVTVRAELPTGEASTRTVMDNYKNAANYDAFRLFWQEGDVIEGVAWQGDDAAWWENAKTLTIPALTADNLTDENKKATFTFDIPDGFDASQPLKIALFYVKDADNDTYSDTYKNNPISFSIGNKGITWHEARIAKRVQPLRMGEKANNTYLTNRTPMMARMEIASGWEQTGVSADVPFRHLATLFGFKIYNTSDADLHLTELELSISDPAKKMFLSDGAVIDPISGNAVPDTNKAAATAITGITDNTIAAASAYTYYLPCVITGDMTGVEYSFKVNGQSAVVKTGKNYKPGVCYSIDIKWDGSAFSLLDHSEASMFSYWIHPDGKILLGWYGDESVVDFSKISALADITEIGAGAFAGLQTLQKVILSDNITSVGGNAFLGTTNLKEVYIPSSVTNLGSAVFRGSSASVTVAADNPNYSSDDGVLFNKDKTILLHFPSSRTGTYTIPSTVKEVGTSAFANSNITSVIFPLSLETISKSAFQYSKKLAEADFTFCTSLKSIGEASFSSSEALQSVHLPGSLATINENAFNWCANLAIVTFAQPSSLTKIAYAAFNGTKLAYMVIPPSVNDLGNSATFSNCTALKEIVLPSEITKIPSTLFYGCSNLNSITIPANVTGIEPQSFTNCTNLGAVYAMPAVHPVLNGVSALKGTLYNTSQAAQDDYRNNGWSMFNAYKIMHPCDVSSNTLTIAASGGNTTVDVITTTSWTTTSNQSWLTVAPQSGSGDATLTITAVANTTGRARVAHIVITADDAPTRLVEVVQGK